MHHLNWSYYYCCFFWPSCWIAYPSLSHAFYLSLLLCLYRPFYLSSFCLSPCCHQNHYCLFSSPSYAPWLSQPSDPYPLLPFPLPIPFPFPASFSPLTYPFLSVFPYPYLLLCLYRPFYLSSFCLSPCCHQNHYCLLSS